MCNNNNLRKRDRGLERGGEWDMIGVREREHGRVEGRKQNGDNDVAIFKLIFLKEKTVEI